MSLASRVRIILRWVHVIVGLVLLCYIYSPFSEKYPLFKSFTRWILVPVVVISGIWMWKFAAFNRFFKIK